MPRVGFDDGCEFVRVPDSGWHDHNRYWTRIGGLDNRLSYKVFAHGKCICNEYQSLSGRVMARSIHPTPDGLKELRWAFARIKDRLHQVEPESYDRVVDYYTGSKKLAYSRAVEQIWATGLTKKQSELKMFVKFEKVKYKSEKVNPDPRAIQYRDRRYGITLARYLKPCEHAIYNLHGNGRYLPPTRVIGKGLNMSERAQLLVHKWRAMRCPRGIGIDVSRFDRHVDRAVLQEEHKVYLSMNPSQEFAKLLSWQLDSTGKSSHGIKYKIKGKRASGDMNTAVGNCLISVAAVVAALRGMTYDILDDGDDCLVLVEEEHYDDVMATIQEKFRSYGLPLKLESTFDDLSEVDWCQCRLIEVEHDKWLFVRHVDKALSCSIAGSKFMHEHARPRLLATIGACELSLNLGVPVLQAYAMAVARAGGAAAGLRMDVDNPYFYRVDRVFRNTDDIYHVKPKPITDVARISFSKAFNIPVREQLELESYFDHWLINPKGGVVVEDEIDLLTWSINKNITPEVYPPP